jgi:hypothetical protein
MVGVGQGVRCSSPKNENRKFTENQEARRMPCIPHLQFCCEYFDVRKNEKNLNKLIFRLHDKIMKGEELNDVENKRLHVYKVMLAEITDE